ncbi:MAG TPA: metalloregulator ArsR/SmtB family transcription factor [Pirellulales bacterium]|nr:metalloregulator ArsR/SmtB family transcription factor [Pirellulales bacterium]
MPDKHLECADLLKALAEKDRLRIVRALGDQEKNVSELAAELEVDIANISHHLGILYQAGILQREKRGRFVVYRIHPKVRAAQASGQLDLGCCKLEWPQEG